MKNLRLTAERVLKLRDKMMLLMSLLLLTGWSCAGESEFYICDVAKRARKWAKVGQPTATNKDLMWSQCAMKAFLYDMMSNAIYSSMHTVKNKKKEEKKRKNGAVSLDI